MKNRFELLIFDWDGTLANSIDWIVECIQNAAHYYHCEIPTPQASRDVIGLGLDESMATLFPSLNDVTKEKLVLKYRELYLAREMTPRDLFFGVNNMLCLLKNKGYRLAIATGKSRSGLQSALVATETETLFTASRCADETASKPDPKMLYQLMQECAVARDRTLMIGDSVHDINMANNASIASMAVMCGAHSGKLLSAHKPLLCLQQTRDLLDFLV